MFHGEYLPAPLLRPYIKNYGVLTDDRSDVNGIYEWVPPFLSKAIVFFYNNSGRIFVENGVYDDYLPLGYVLPQVKKSNLWSYKHGFSSFAIIFHPGKFRYFFQVPMLEFLNKVIAVDEFGEEDLIELHKKIEDSISTQQRVDHCDDCFLKRLRDVENSRDLIDVTLSKMLATPKLSITEIRKDLNVNISERHFRRRFQEEIGMSPKGYQKQLRFLRALDSLQSGQFTSIADVAYACGYYDQSQFNLHFKEYLQVSPLQYLHKHFPITQSIYWRED